MIPLCFRLPTFFRFCFLAYLIQALASFCVFLLLVRFPFKPLTCTDTLNRFLPCFFYVVPRRNHDIQANRRQRSYHWWRHFRKKYKRTHIKRIKSFDFILFIYTHYNTTFIYTHSESSFSTAASLTQTVRTSMATVKSSSEGYVGAIRILRSRRSLP